MTFHVAPGRSKSVVWGSALAFAVGVPWILAACVAGQSNTGDDFGDPSQAGSGQGAAGNGSAGQVGSGGNATAGTTGSGGQVGGGGVSGNGTAGTGTAGSGIAGSGTAGSGTAGSGTAGAGTAGSGTAGSGTAGSGTAGSGAGGTGAAGAGGSGTAGTGTAGSGGSGGGSTGPRQLYISPTGKDSNAGTQDAPLFTLTQASLFATAGSTIWAMDGTFNYTATVKLAKSGTAAATINVTAVAGAHPIFDFSALPVDSGSYGIDLSGDYWHFTGLEIRKAGDNCVHIGGSNNTMERLVIHECSDTGLQISASSSAASDNTRAANNTILNCDSYLNYDAPTKGENADGFAAKLYIGPGNMFKGCRSYNNADDGWDFIASRNVVTVDGCWSFLNGKLPSGDSNPAGDGNGFKLGGIPAGGIVTGEGNAAHIVKNSFGFENLACGFTRNSNPSSPMLTSCGANNNGKGDYCQNLATPKPEVTMTMTGAQAKAATRDASGNLPPMK
ncbi:MAG TPA: right-handed parallel beta-helix repeat-containing protein [Polyangiaceae bacterium]